MVSDWYSRLIKFSTLLALSVVVLGAYVRLSDAGLGCPDWPGCYGEITPTTINSDTANAEFPERPLETGKAWREMAHRYVAAILGFLIVLIAWLAWRNSHIHTWCRYFSGLARNVDGHTTAEAGDCHGALAGWPRHAGTVAMAMA